MNAGERPRPDAESAQVRRARVNRYLTGGRFPDRKASTEVDALDVSTMIDACPVAIAKYWFT